MTYIGTVRVRREYGESTVRVRHTPKARTGRGKRIKENVKRISRCGTKCLQAPLLVKRRGAAFLHTSLSLQVHTI